MRETSTELLNVEGVNVQRRHVGLMATTPFTPKLSRTGSWPWPSLLEVYLPHSAWAVGLGLVSWTRYLPHSVRAAGLGQVSWRSYLL